jgi:hypothetical protein
VRALDPLSTSTIDLTLSGVRDDVRRRLNSSGTGASRESHRRADPVASRRYEVQNVGRDGVQLSRSFSGTGE